MLVGEESDAAPRRESAMIPTQVAEEDAARKDLQAVAPSIPP